MAGQGTHEFIMMGHINFEDHVLIKRWKVAKKMNVMGKKFKDKKKWGNHKKQFAFVVGSCVHFLSSRVHNNMSAKSAIEKLQKIVKEKEAQKSEHR
jgi:hypothetical protein